MIGKLLGLIVTALIVWVVYVTLFGTAEERQKRDALFQSVKALGKDVGDIFAHERDKFKSGAYDNALHKISQTIESLRQADKDRGEYSAKLDELLKQKKALDAKLQQAKQLKSSTGEDKALEQEITDLNNKIQNLSKEMESKQK